MKKWLAKAKSKCLRFGATTRNARGRTGKGEPELGVILFRLRAGDDWSWRMLASQNSRTMHKEVFVTGVNCMTACKLSLLRSLPSC
jgi:hypothetical protein